MVKKLQQFLRPPNYRLFLRELWPKSVPRRSQTPSAFLAKRPTNFENVNFIRVLNKSVKCELIEGESPETAHHSKNAIRIMRQSNTFLLISSILFFLNEKISIRNKFFLPIVD